MDFDMLLIRKWFTNRSTIGELFFSDNLSERICYILEDEARASDVKIPHFTCIPSGDYSVRLTMSNRFKRVLPLIYNVSIGEENGVKMWNYIKNGNVIFTGVRIHKGNVDGDTDACQLPGMIKGIDRVIDSGAAFDPLFEKMNSMIGTSGVLRYRIIHQQEI